MRVRRSVIGRGSSAEGQVTARWAAGCWEGRRGPSGTEVDLLPAPHGLRRFEIEGIAAGRPARAAWDGRWAPRPEGSGGPAGDRGA